MSPIADNVTVGGVVYATEDIGGVQAQIVKPAFGGDGVATVVQQAAGLPVNLVASGGSGVQTTGTITAAGASTLAGNTSSAGAIVVDVSSAGNISFHLLTSAFVGTVVFEQSYDPAGANGTWGSIPVNPEDQTSAPMASLAINTAAAYVRQFTQDMFGPKLFRIRASVFTSGTLTALGSAGPGWVALNPSLAPSTAFIGSVSLAASVTPTLAAFTTSGTANTNTVPVAADGNRKGMTVWNRGTAALNLGFGVATTSTLFNVSIPPGEGWAVEPAFAPFALNVSSPSASQPFNVGTAA